MAKATKTSITATLLVELLTEELPPKSLKSISESFGMFLAADLKRDGLLTGEDASICFATPRRLAVLIPGVLDKGAELRIEQLGPPVAAPKDAVDGFARKYGVTVDQLFQVDTPKGKRFACKVRKEAPQLEKLLATKVEAALKALPIQKLMRWGDGEAQFVRPVHGLVMMHGKRVVPGSVLGLRSGNLTRGHRFMSKGPIRLSLADGYESQLRKKGWVIADFEIRRTEIKHQLKAEAMKHKASLGGYHDLLDEVTALVEYPAVYAGEIDRSFLELPVAM